MWLTVQGYTNIYSIFQLSLTQQKRKYDKYDFQVPISKSHQRHHCPTRKAISWRKMWSIWVFDEAFRDVCEQIFLQMKRRRLVYFRGQSGRNSAARVNIALNCPRLMEASFQSYVYGKMLIISQFVWKKCFFPMIHRYKQPAWWLKIQ